MTWIISKALMQAYENSHSSPVRVAASSAANSSAGRRSLQSNGSPTPLAYWFNDKTTEASPRFPSGMTSQRLTETHGEAVLMWFREAFLAKTSAAPARAPASPARAQDFGVRWRELSTRYNHDLHLWKIPPSLWDEGWTSSLPTLPRWGLMRAGVLWERVTLARLTNETGSGYSLPTPVKYDAHGTWEGNNYHGLGWQAKHGDRGFRPAGEYEKGYRPGETEAAYQERIAAADGLDAPLPVPAANGTANSRRVLMFPTPKALDHNKRGNFNADDPRNGLAGAVRRSMFPTPTNMDARPKQSKRPPERVRFTASGLPEADRESGNGAQLSLAQAAHIANRRQMLPTPMSTNGLRGGSKGPAGDHYPNMWQSPGHPEFGELSPTWVEWIMGWVRGWTSLQPLPAGNLAEWLDDNGETDRGGDQWGEDPSDSPKSGVTKTIPKSANVAEEAERISRIAALGNGQVSAVAAAAFLHLYELNEPAE